MVFQAIQPGGNKTLHVPKPGLEHEHTLARSQRVNHRDSLTAGLYKVKKASLSIEYDT